MLKFFARRIEENRRLNDLMDGVSFPPQEESSMKDYKPGPVSAGIVSMFALFITGTLLLFVAKWFHVLYNWLFPLGF
jgi:hypothetical protein